MKVGWIFLKLRNIHQRRHFLGIPWSINQSGGASLSLSVRCDSIERESILQLFYRTYYLVELWCILIYCDWDKGMLLEPLPLVTQINAKIGKLCINLG